VIGTNKSDASETVSSLLGAIRDGSVIAHGRSGELDRLLAGRGIRALDMQAWHRINDAEIERGARRGRRRTTLAHRSELLAAAAGTERADAGESPPPASDPVQRGSGLTLLERGG
jgi:ferredoxin--NADP+ reductase